MKITIDLSENEILSLESCVEISENEGYEKDKAHEALRKIREAVQQSVEQTGED